MNYCLDTNTLIYFFKGVGNVGKHLLAVAPGSIAVPTIVLFEIEFGLAKSRDPGKRQAQLQSFFSVVSLIPFRSKEARVAAKLRAALEARGTPIGPYDILIASTAVANQLTLVTHNLAEFRRVPGLKTVDWF